MARIRKAKPIECHWQGPLQCPATIRQTIVQRGEALLNLPRRHLQAYEDVREASPLGESYAWAARIFESVDQLVVLGNRPNLRPIRALLDAGLDPFHNQMTRADRGSKPRIYFIDDRLDDDQVASTLAILDAIDGRKTLPERRWGLITIGDDDELPAANLFRDAYQFQSDPFPDCMVQIECDDASPLGIGTLYVAAAAGLDTIGLLVGGMTVSDAVIEATGASTHERLVQLFASRGKIQIHQSALDRWVGWYDRLAPVRSTRIAIKTSRSRVYQHFDPSSIDAAIELPVLDTTALGTLFQSAMLGCLCEGHGWVMP